MKFTIIQLATLALAFGVSAAPLNERDCDEVGFGGSNSTRSATADFSDFKNAAAKSTTVKKADKTTKASSKATSAADNSDSAQSTTKASKASATDDSGSAATTTKAGKASATGGSGSGSSKTASGSAAGTTKASSTSGSGSSGGSSGGSLPASSGTSVLSAAQTIAAGASFDGGMVMFDRGVSCTGQAEGGDSDAVFQIENGGSISNVIIGPNQIEGIHCQGACTLTNVWWSAVCEDAFTIKNQGAGETTKISGGGAFGAEDKVFQHNGAGTLDVSGFTVGTFGKLYRSCGNCKTMFERHVIMSDITGSDGSIVAGINSNYGDTATITNSQFTGVKDICVTFTGNDSGDEPVKNGSGADGTNCIFGSDVTSS